MTQSTRQWLCKHQTLEVLEFNALGATVGCLVCSYTFDLPAQSVSDQYVGFTHTSPGGKDEDRYVLIHHSCLSKEE